MRRGVLSVSRLSSHLLSARPMSALAQQGSFPAALDLISSTDPAYWTKLVDLTASCPAVVHDFNAKNPQSKITVLGKCEHLNPGMVSRHFSKWGLVVVVAAAAMAVIVAVLATTTTMTSISCAPPPLPPTEP